MYIVFYFAQNEHCRAVCVVEEYVSDCDWRNAFRADSGWPWFRLRGYLKVSESIKICL